MRSDRNEHEDRFEYSADELPSLAVVSALAEVVGEDPENLPPLGKRLPFDALDTLIEEGEDVVVTFSYETWRITVCDDGSIVIRD